MRNTIQISNFVSWIGNLAVGLFVFVKGQYSNYNQRICIQSYRIFSQNDEAYLCILTALSFNTLYIYTLIITAVLPVYK